MFNDSPNDAPKDINSLIREGYTVTPVEYLNQGWEIFKQNTGGFIGFLLLCILINLILSGPATFARDPNQISDAAKAWNSVGRLVYAVISPALNAGFIFVALKILKQRATTFGDFFKGFQNGRFLPIFLASLVSGLIIGIIGIMVPMVILFGLLIVLSPALGIPPIVSSAGLNLAPNVILLLFVVTLLALLPGIYLGVSYAFSIPLLLDRRFGFWDAIETSRKIITKRWFSFFGFLLLLGLLNFVGMLLCLVGLLVTAPVTSCAIVAAYRDIVGLNASSEMEY